MKAVLCGDLSPAGLDLWRQALSAAAPDWQFLSRAQALREPLAVRAAVVANPPPGSLEGLPHLGLIQSLWAGVDRLLADPTLPPAVPLARMVDPMMGAAMAETALWAVLSLQRGFFDYARQQRQGLWQPLPQRRADQTRVTLLGLGALGRAVATALQRQGLVLNCWTRSPLGPDSADFTRPGRVDSPGAASSMAGRVQNAQPALPLRGIARTHGAAALPALLARSDIVVNLLPLTPATQGLIDAAFLAALPAGAALVNLARGAHVIEADLLAALDSGRLRHAVLDVFAIEPLPSEHPFWGHERVTVLPHVAALTDLHSAAAVVALNLGALAEGRPLAHTVDRQLGY